MKIPDTKYSIGDTLWKISNNVVCKYKVTAINIFIGKIGTSIVKYEMYNENTRETIAQLIGESEVTESFYETKNALRQAMFGGCID